MAPFGVDMIESNGQWTLSLCWRTKRKVQLYLGVEGLVESFCIRFKIHVEANLALYQSNTSFKA